MTSVTEKLEHQKSETPAIQVNEANAGSKSELDVPSEGSLDPETVDGDEALRLVGSVRRDNFDDEYNTKLRKKLDRYIPTICAAVYFTQFLDKNTLSYAR